MERILIFRVPKGLRVSELLDGNDYVWVFSISANWDTVQTMTHGSITLQT